MLNYFLDIVLLVVQKVNNFVTNIDLPLSFSCLKVINLQVVNVYITVY